MALMVHKLRVPLSSASVTFTRAQLQAIADAINEKAEGRRLMGQIQPPLDGKTRLDRVTHVVLSDAKVRGHGIRVSIEVLDTNAGRILKALIEGKIPLRGSVRGFMLGCHPGNSISSLDIDMSPDPELTVLDDIVDALEGED